MRILMLAQWYPPIIGGEELHVRNLSVELVARGHEVTVATLAQPGLAETESHDGVEVVRLRGSAQRIAGLFADPNRQSTPPIPDPELVVGLGRLARRMRPDVMHAHNWIVHSSLPLRLTRRTPLLLSLHDFSLVCATKVLIRRGVNCSGPAPLKCLSCAASHYGAVKGTITTIGNAAGAAVERRAISGFIPVSNAVAQGNRLAGLPYRVIPNFVRGQASTGELDLAPYLGQLPDEPFLLFVGALGRLKGLDVLLDAYRLLGDAPPLVVIGYPMRETDQLLADPPPNVRVLGPWPPAAVGAAWDAALMGIVPSTCQEACPTVVIEAMRAGLPVVATRMGGIPDLVVDGETGLLVTPSEPRALADAIARLVADPSEAARLGEAGHRRSAQFSADAVVPRIEAAYREVIETGTLRAAS
jgi:glycosyltransferase involved in cell wall biosynthesis